MHTLYNILLVPVRWLASLAALWFRKDRSRSDEWLQRRGRTVPDARPGGLWIHGASVGEARIVASLAARLRQADPLRSLVGSAYTRTGRASLPGKPILDDSFYMPLDIPGYPARVLKSVRPSALVLVETELWPNLIREAAACRVPVIMVNGRLSVKRMDRYRRLASLYRPLLQALTAVGIQSPDDADRFIELGVDRERITVTGNIKYDLPRPAVPADTLAARFGLSRDRPVLVAGSTGPGEESEVLEAFREIRTRRPDAFLILAPRHPERCAGVHRDALSSGFNLHRLSGGDEPAAGATAGLLVDTLGELAALYSLATAAFVGGSLVPIGGHNVLEPAAAGVPVLFGPHHEHFKEPARALIDAGGGQVVEDSAALARAFLAHLAAPEQAAAAGAAGGRVVESNRGALERSVALISSTLQGGAGA